MGYVLLGGIVLLVGYALYRFYGRLGLAARGQLLRWGVGGSAALLTVGLALGRRLDLAVFTGAAAFQVLRFGRLGPINLGGDKLSSDNVSKVRSQFFAMELDHDTSSVAGRVIAGQFKGWELMDLGEAETRALIVEIAGDADSVSLLESWLDANRAGWREYFEETAAGETAPQQPINAEAEAYEVLGLKPGATADEIKAAHRELMKGVHPDHGGSSYLAAKINEARDLLLRSVGRG